MNSRCYLCGVVVGFVIAMTVHAANADWTSFRNGGTSTAATALPKHWTPTSGVSWQLELAGYGQSAPVVWDNRVYVISVVGPQKERAVVTCLAQKNGESLWSYEFETSQQAPSNYMNSRAAPSPMVDAAGVYAFFESGDLVALSHAGELRWNLSLVEKFGPLKSNHGLGSSPAQTDQSVLLNVEHGGPSHLISVAKQTGEIEWQVERPSGSSWTSPIVRETEQGTQVIVSSQGTVTGYAADSGEQVWQVTGLEGNTVPSPCYQSNRLVIGARLPEFGSARVASESNMCLEFSESANAQPEVAWRAQKAVCDYASPVIAGDFVYILTKVGVLHCLDLKTGATHYRERVDTQTWATPIVAQDRLYLFGKNGETTIVGIGPEFELIERCQLWDLEDPPAPENYVEAARGGHGHGGPAESATKSETADQSEASEEERPPGGRFTRMLLANDANENGQLEADEIPERMAAMLNGGDTNKDGVLNQAEIQKMAESFQKRRAGSRQSARDPIVYGVAASNGELLIRTGTRLYCIGGTE